MMVVVRAELWAVQRTVEKMRTKPKTQERRNWAVKTGSDQPPNSGIHRIMIYTKINQKISHLRLCPDLLFAKRTPELRLIFIN